MTILLANGCEGDVESLQRYVLRPVSNTPCDLPIECWNDTESAVVAAGDFCPSPSIDLAYAFQEQVWIVCGNAGDFSGVAEQPHGGFVVNTLPPVADYHFDLDGPSKTSINGRIDDALVWEDQLYVLRLPAGALPPGNVVSDVHRLVRLTVDSGQVDQGVGEPVLTLYARTPRVLLHPAAIDDPTLRLAWPALGLARWEQP